MGVRLIKHTVFLASLCVAVVSAVSGCSSSERDGSPVRAKSQPPRARDEKGPVIPAGSIPAGQAQVIQLESGAEVLVHNLGGTNYLEIQAILDDESFIRMSAGIAHRAQAEREAWVSRELDRVIAKIHKEAGGIALERSTDVAYFSFLLPYRAEGVMSAVKELEFKQGLLMNPVAYLRNPVKEIKAMTPASEGLVRREGVSTAPFSGLERIKAPEFVRLAEAEIGTGVKVDGSSVKLGITDTGITYNHPTFLSLSTKKSRVAYMRDFTREGRVYFHPNAKFEVTIPADGSEADLNISAELILTTKLPALPAGDKLTALEKPMLVKVSPELKQILTTPGSGAKLGLLLEESLQAAGEPVDVNRNGKLDDKLPLILIPGETAAQDRVYFDPSGAGDFRKSVALGDFNATGAVTRIHSEKVGFDFRSDKLPNAKGDGVIEVRSASLVGFDPGNHGSHVGGIAGGSKTLSNDDDLTLARGVAPEAVIQMNRVCANNGGCNAMNAFIDLATQGKAEVINMSLGGLNPYNDGYGVEEAAINRLTSVTNTLFVISAGNSGPGRQTVGSPSTARLSLSVGATATRSMIERQYQWPGAGASSSGGAGAPLSDEDDFMLFFSSRGPTAAGGFKPNVSAPGTELSAIQLNAAPGRHAGLDVYWGTSMAAPTVAGAYALLLDAIKKHNVAHPSKPLASEAATLRRVLIETARPFDVTTFDPATGAKRKGQYTWMDQGTGMIDLVAAWKKLVALRDLPVESPVRLDGNAVELDYQVLVDSKKNPNGLPYDGSRPNPDGAPVFGTGLYLDASTGDTLHRVHLSRRLPESLAAGERAGELEEQLHTTFEEFVLKTVIHGSDKKWLKAGVLDALNCADSPEENLVVYGQGATVGIKAGSETAGEIRELKGTALNVCVDRRMIAEELSPGDHGALISAYRMVGGRVSEVASFVVPVSLTIPHKTLAGSTAYETSGDVKSFGVSRNYVKVPEGTSVVRVTLEVPALKRDASGQVAPGETCSGIELMSLEGGNTAGSFPSRAAARISNCDALGAPVEEEAKRRLVLARANPNAGVWDLHVFGSYKYALSKYKLRVDYVTAKASVTSITGGLAALNGSIEWKMRESSISVTPSSTQSALELNGLLAETHSQVAKGANLVVENALGSFRKYPAEAKSVVITTGGSSGNDIDLVVLGCAEGTTSIEDASCAKVASSGTATDVERAAFAPKAGKVYAIVVHGYDVKDEGKFVSGETIGLAPEKGTVVIRGEQPAFAIEHSMLDEQVAASRILSNELFALGKYSAVGALTLRTEEDVVLGAIPVKVSR